MQFYLITQVASYLTRAIAKVVKSPPRIKTEGIMLNEIITVYAIIDDFLRAIGHKEDCRREMSDAEIITTALIAAMFFDGNYASCCSYMKDHNLIPNMLDKSRFNRRLHNISMLINDLFHQIGMIFKETSDSTEYLLDSFPVPICDNIRIFHVKLITAIFR
ncbi:MAG: hypothetical protein V7L00_29735 [Nostoc sp.]